MRHKIVQKFEFERVQENLKHAICSTIFKFNFKSGDLLHLHKSASKC